MPAMTRHELLISSQDTASLIKAITEAQLRVSQRRAETADAMAQYAEADARLSEAIADLNQAIDILAHPSRG